MSKSAHDRAGFTAASGYLDCAPADARTDDTGSLSTAVFFVPTPVRISYDAS